MSKIGKMPIMINNGVNVTVQGNIVQVGGVKGNAQTTLPDHVVATVQDSTVVITAENLDDKRVRALYGLTRATVANLIKGVDTGFEKRLELTGVGYKAQMQGIDLVLSLGFSHPVKITPITGVTFAVADNKIVVSGTNKILVGEMAAKVRSVKPPEPYKGKGIRYTGEQVRRKAGKAAKAAGK